MCNYKDKDKLKSVVLNVTVKKKKKDRSHDRFPAGGVCWKIVYLRAACWSQTNILCLKDVVRAGRIKQK